MLQHRTRVSSICHLLGDWTPPTPLKAIIYHDWKPKATTSIHYPLSFLGRGYHPYMAITRRKSRDPSPDSNTHVIYHGRRSYLQSLCMVHMSGKDGFGQEALRAQPNCARGGSRARAWMNLKQRGFLKFARFLQWALVLVSRACSVHSLVSPPAGFPCRSHSPAPCRSSHSLVSPLLL